MSIALQHTTVIQQLDQILPYDVRGNHTQKQLASFYTSLGRLAVFANVYVTLTRRSHPTLSLLEVSLGKVTVKYINHFRDVFVTR